MPQPDNIIRDIHIPESKQPPKDTKKLKLIILFLLFTLLLITFLTGGYLLYSSLSKCKDEKEDCIDQLQALESEDGDGNENEEDDTEDSEDSDCPECECDCPECVCPGSSDSCAIDFTEEEELMMEDWIEYSNSTYHYSFMHPPGWMIVNTSPESLEAGEAASFEYFVLAGAPLETSILPNPLFTIENGSVIEVDCAKAFKMRVSQNGGDPWEGVATYVINNGTPYVIWVRFRDEGASITSDTIELYNLILKTFEFE